MRAIVQFTDTDLRLAGVHDAGLESLVLSALHDLQEACLAGRVTGRSDAGEDESDPDRNGACDPDFEDDEHGNPWDSGDESAGWRRVGAETLPVGFRRRLLETWALALPLSRNVLGQELRAARRDVTHWDAGVDIDGSTEWRAVLPLGPLWALVLEAHLPDGVHFDDGDTLYVSIVRVDTDNAAALDRVALADIGRPLQVRPRAA